MTFYALSFLINILIVGTNVMKAWSNDIMFLIKLQKYVQLVSIDCLIYKCRTGKPTAKHLPKQVIRSSSSDVRCSPQREPRSEPIVSQITELFRMHTTHTCSSSGKKVSSK